MRALDKKPSVTEYYQEHEQAWRESGVMLEAHDMVEHAPLEQSVVLIPVAAHQESATIYHALGEYARQTGATPFSVVLNMNWPTSADGADVTRCFAELKRARQDFPQLDIRTIQREYLDDAPMGTIRGDLWDTALAAGIAGGTLDDEHEMLAFNHDIDTEKIPRRTMQIAQQHFAASAIHLCASDESPRPFGVRMMHGFDAAAPNSSRAVGWMDTIYRMRRDGYDAGLVIPMRHYAAAGGMARDVSIGEVQDTLERAGVMRGMVSIASPAMVTSPRRAIGRVGDGYGLEDIWSDGSFHSTDKYREAASSNDISKQQLDTMVEAFAERNLHTALFRSALYALKQDHLRQQHPGARLDNFSLGDADMDEIINHSEQLQRSVDVSARLANRLLRVSLDHPNADLITARALVRIWRVTGSPAGIAD